MGAIREKSKVIFIPITRGFIIRNVLRSGGCDLLHEEGFKIVVLLPLKKIPEYLKEEFKDRSVIFESISEPEFGKFHQVFIKLLTSLVFTKSTVRYLKYGNTRLIERSRVLTYVNIALAWFLSKFIFLGPLLRRCEMRFDESTDEIRSVFDKYNPDIVFGTSISSKYDVAFMKEAKRRRVPTAGMPKGWDNLTRTYFRFLPDYAIVQNEVLKSAYINIQGANADKIYVIGFPQFDWYARNDVVVTREKHLKKFGFDPKKKLIFFGSEGAWSSEDIKVAQKIHSWIQNGRLAEPAQVLFRPHFSNIHDVCLKQFEDKENFVIDRTLVPSEYFVDNWDPGVTQIEDLTNSIIHCDVLVTTASTLNLDAACADKPAINLAFGGKYRGKQDITPFLYRAVHIEWMLETKAVELARNENDLLRILNSALAHPGRLAGERVILRDKLCYKVDGKSSERLVGVLVKICDDVNQPV